MKNGPGCDVNGTVLCFGKSAGKVMSESKAHADLGMAWCTKVCMQGQVLRMGVLLRIARGALRQTRNIVQVP
jgi:hypothetical protein